jgi:hypothetical protein
MPCVDPDRNEPRVVAIAQFDMEKTGAGAEW